MDKQHVKIAENKHFVGVKNTCLITLTRIES